MKGFFKRLLVVDLSNRSSRVDPLDEDVLRRCLGGKGLASHLLLERNPKGVDPFDPANHILFALGSASGSSIYGSCRHGVYSKSPLTGFFGESYSGGSLAIPMSKTGYDAIMIDGASDKPVWLEIGDSDVVFHDASDLWGKETFETEIEVKRRVNDPKAGVMVIGPAGENRVRFASIKNDGWRMAGRAGMGAVLGSKRVKALAFHGSKIRPYADPDGIKAYTKQMLKDLKDHPATHAYRNMGTPMMVDLLNKAGGFPTRYWAEGVYEHSASINAQSMKERLNAKPGACRTCFVACAKKTEVLEGRHKGLKMEGPEYETIYSFGGLCYIDKIEEIAYLNNLCDRLGMDTISSGNLAAFAIEASRRGKISDSLEYGNPDQVADILHKIVRREGVGGLLAEGVRPAGEELGLEDIVVHVKGMEPAGYDPRALKGMGLAYAVADRGACHLRTTFYKPELTGLSDPASIEGKTELFLDFEDRCTLFDTMIFCRFYRDFYPWEELPKVVALTTGLELEKADLRAIAARVTNNARRFNIREGLSPSDDRLPKRFLNETLKDGRGITSAEMDTLVREYYKMKGWSDEGVPPDED